MQIDGKMLGVSVKGGFMRVTYRECGSKSTIRKSNKISSDYSALYCRCNDPECGHTFILSLNKVLNIYFTSQDFNFITINSWVFNTSLLTNPMTIRLCTRLSFTSQNNKSIGQLYLSMLSACNAVYGVFSTEDLKIKR